MNLEIRTRRNGGNEQHDESRISRESYRPHRDLAAGEPEDEGELELNDVDC